MKSVLFVLMVLPVISLAAEWKFVEPAYRDKLFYLDSASITENQFSRERYIWGMVVYKIAVKGKKYTKYRNKVNCNTQQYSPMSYTNFNKNGAILGGQDYQESTWMSAPPETTAEKFITFACNKDEAAKLPLVEDPLNASSEFWKNLH